MYILFGGKNLQEKLKIFAKLFEKKSSNSQNLPYREYNFGDP